METIIEIKKGEVTFDVQDGEGQECREKNKRRYDLLRKRFGLPDEAFKEDCKPEMQHEQEDKHTL